MHRKFDTILHPDQTHPALAIRKSTQEFIGFTSLRCFYCFSKPQKFCSNKKARRDYLVETNDTQIKVINLISPTVF